MNVWVALLRRINVGGKNVLKMKELVALLERMGPSDVKTYVQSGNVVFKSLESTGVAMWTVIEKALHGSSVNARVLVLGRAEFGHAIASNPFPQTEEHPNTLHLFFCRNRHTIQTLSP